jgi:hypothetical protein
MLPPAPRVPALAGRAAALALVFAALLGALLVLVRPWYTSWGTTDEERSGALPGDGLVPGPVRETRAIAIAAPATQVFAWVAQIGQDRGGFYSYELLEDLVGCEMPNVRELDPELQRWNVGSKLWMYPPDELDGLGHATLIHHEPGRALIFGTNTPSDPPGSAPTGAWSFVVEPTGPDSARLITRASGGAMPTLLGTAYTLAIFEPLHFAMERRMLEGIRGLAEGHPISPARDALQLGTWLATFAAFVAAGALALRGRAFWRRLATFGAAGAAFQIVTLAQPSPLLGFGLVIALALLSRPSASATPDHGAGDSARVLEPASRPARQAGQGEGACQSPPSNAS